LTLRVRDLPRDHFARTITWPPETPMIVAINQARTIKNLAKTGDK